MQQAVRRIPSAIVSWMLLALVLLILVQVFLAGAFVLGGMDLAVAHIGLGHGIATLALVLFILAFVARDRVGGWVGVGIFVLASLQSPLIAGEGDWQWLKAFHVLDAFLIFGAALSLLHSRRPGRHTALAQPVR